MRLGGRMKRSKHQFNQKESYRNLPRCRDNVAYEKL